MVTHVMLIDESLLLGHVSANHVDSYRFHLVMPPALGIFTRGKKMSAYNYWARHTQHISDRPIHMIIGLYGRMIRQLPYKGPHLN